ncbi:MAG TPA: hemolysin family protein [Gemmatimonadales bacterium]
MELFFFAVATVLVVSAVCSLTEAALYAVPAAYVRQLNEAGGTAGRLLLDFKQNMERPITAILVLNTAANTAGAAVAGSQARLLFGEAALIWFPALFTLAVLFFAEILPKVAGVAYNRTVARVTAVPLKGAMVGLYPLVWLSQRATRVVQRSGSHPVASEEEVGHMVDLSAEEGSILPLEAELVRNVLALNDVTARDIMTPRTVVFKVAANTTVGQLSAQALRLAYSRIPVYDPNDPENWHGVVLRRNLLARLAGDEFDVTIGSMCRAIHFVPETIAGHQLLAEFLKRREHLFGVVDEYGAVVGIVTLEDVLEALIGSEIVDETDAIVDMQEAARERIAKRLSEADAGDDSPSS